MKISLMAARVNAALSRRDVSDMTGISISRLSLIESGKSSPRAVEVQKLCSIYGVGIEDLRFEDVQPVGHGARTGGEPHERATDGKGQ